MMDNIQPKVSIIVPVHNAGVYLCKCLDSLVNQTLTDIEIIVVLDCPSDGSDKVAEAYAEKDTRIILVYNDKNMHIGLSRNEGLKVAKGQYIGFSDHDDFCEPDMYEIMYTRALNENADIVVSPASLVVGEQCRTLYYPDCAEGNLRDVLLGLLIGRGKEGEDWDPFVRSGCLWNKIFKKELIANHSIVFLDNRKVTFEDLLFLLPCFYYASKVVLVNEKLYLHREEVGNTSSKYSYYSYPLIGKYLELLFVFLHDKGIYEENKERFFYAVTESISDSVINEYRASKMFYEKVNIFIFFRRYSFVKEAFRSVGIRRNNIPLIRRLLKSIVYIIFRY